MWRVFWQQPAIKKQTLIFIIVHFKPREQDPSLSVHHVTASLQRSRGSKAADVTLFLKNPQVLSLFPVVNLWRVRGSGEGDGRGLARRWSFAPEAAMSERMLPCLTMTFFCISTESYGTSELFSSFWAFVGIHHGVTEPIYIQSAEGQMLWCNVTGAERCFSCRHH